MSKIQIGRLSEEKYLLEYDKYSSNMYSNDQSDFLGNFNDRDVRHKRTRKMGIQKYLRKSCYHRIKCTVITFLTTFMWRIPLSSATLAIITHRKLKRVFDGTSI